MGLQVSALWLLGPGAEDVEAVAVTLKGLVRKAGPEGWAADEVALAVARVQEGVAARWGFTLAL